MARVRPYRFAGLPTLTREQVAVQQSIALYLSQRPLDPKFWRNAEAMLQTVLKTPVQILFEGPRAALATEVLAQLPDPCCVAVLDAGAKHKLLLELDLALAHAAVDRLLGGPGHGGAAARPLTDIEQGVLSYALLGVLRQFHDAWSTGRELPLTLDRITSDRDLLRKLLGADEHYHLLPGRVALKPSAGHARLLLPNAMITEVFGSAGAQGEATALERRYMRHLLESLGDREILARVEVCTLDVAAGEVAKLEPGDIIVADQHHVTLTPEGVEGSVFVRIGTGQNGGLKARLFVQDEQARLEIVEIVKQRAAGQGADMQADSDDNDGGEGQDADSEALAETEGLLHDVPAPVVVELARLRMSAAQVVRLRQGQILRLPRGPNDPVDLVVNGKLFARGELVDVEGELGVRLVHIVGAP